MEIWTTFAPGKIAWEITFIQTKGKNPSSDWQKHKGLIDSALQKLKLAGISGIRLAIFPSEITQDGQTFNWSPIKSILDYCSKYKLKVDLCIGPFQYPHYPGIYLPPEMLKALSDEDKYIDGNVYFAEFGKRFLIQLMAEFGNDKKIHGFHLANEWPDGQRVEGRRDLKLEVSKKFMIGCAKLLKSLTSKPISLNTNIEATDRWKISSTFGEILTILSSQVKLGFDIYPSQYNRRNIFFQKLHSLFRNYIQSFKSIQKKYPKCEMYFAEIEAQPWGSGQSWSQLIGQAQNPNAQVLKYSNHALSETFKKYITNSNCKIVSLWGSDFWIAADYLGIKWPLEQVRDMALSHAND